MPIVYEPAQPVNAAVSLGAGGGAASVRAQTNPLLVAQQGNMLGLYGQGAALSARAVEGAAERSQNASQFRLQQELQAREQGNNRDLEASMFQARQEGQLAQQRQSADLQNWLMNQEMSQKEVMRLQQQKAAIGDVEANPNLSRAEKDEFIMKLRTGIDVGDARMKAQQAKSMATHDELVQKQVRDAARLEQDQRAFKAKTVQQRVEVVHDPVMAKQVEQEFDQHYPDWRQQMASATAGLDQNAVAALTAQRKQIVGDELQARGGVYSRVEVAPGKYEPFHSATEQRQQGGAGGSAGGGAGGKGPKTVMSAEEWQDAYNKVTAAVNKDTEVPEDKKGIIRDQRMVEIEQGYKAYAERNMPEARKPFGGRQPPKPSVPTGPAGAQATGEGVVAAPPKPFNLAEPGTMNVNQRKAIDTLDQFAASLGNRSEVPEDRRVAATLAVNRAKELIAKHGKVPTEGEDKKEYDRLERVLDLIPPEPKPSAQSPPPAAARRPPPAFEPNLLSS